MKTLTIKVDNTVNVNFLRELLSKFSFVKEIESNEKQPLPAKTRHKMMPIRWATAEPKTEDFTSIISDRKLSLTEIREKAWKRNW
ncbi:MAG: hypothetical protein WCI92_00050 [Bacteroidota bacterium]